jgi:hypothetical protein
MLLFKKRVYNNWDQKKGINQGLSLSGGGAVFETLSFA